VLDKGLIQTLRRRGIDRSKVAATTRMFDFADPEDEARASLALSEISGDEDESDAPALPDHRERIDSTRREKLRKSVERLRAIFEESKRWLDFRETQFRAALDCSLRLMEIEGGLTAEPLEREKARRYEFPTASLERNPSWRESSTACEHLGARARILAHGMPAARSVRLSSKTPTLHRSANPTSSRGSSQFICTWNTGSASGCWVDSSRKGLSIMTSCGPASHKRRALCRLST
jgi:hypothetical protein